MKGKPFQQRSKETQAQNAPSYSLRRPLASQISKIDWQSEKLSSEQWRFLNRIFAQFAEILPAQLTPVVQLRAVVELEEAEHCSFKEFLSQFPDPTPFAIFSLNERTRGLWAVDGSLAFSILEYLTGGKGDLPEEIREFTDIENTLFQKHILGHFLSAYSEAWSQVTELNLKIEQMEFSPNRLVLFAYAETIVVARFVLRLGSISGTLHLALPFRYIREVIPKNPDEYITQSHARKTQADSAQPAISPLVGKKIEAASLPVTVELGKAEVFFQDLLGLEEGDVLRLASLRGEPLRIKVAGKTKFLGKPGACENKIAVQITQLAQEGDENSDE